MAQQQLHVAHVGAVGVDRLRRQVRRPSRQLDDGGEIEVAQPRAVGRGQAEVPQPGGAGMVRQPRHDGGAGPPVLGIQLGDLAPGDGLGGIDLLLEEVGHPVAPLLLHRRQREVHAITLRRASPRP